MAIHSENGLLAAFRGEDDLRTQSEALQRAVDCLKAWGDVVLLPDQAIISLVGPARHEGHFGVASSARWARTASTSR